jgi:hypothetical protein
MGSSILVWLTVAAAASQTAAPTPAPVDLQNLSKTLRDMLAKAMPATLYEASPNWGHTSRVPNGLKWHGLRPEVRRTWRNDGTWRKIRLTTRNLDKSLALELRDWQHPAADRMTFTVFIAFDAGVEFEQQIWESGVRLYSGSLRAETRVQLTLQCELLLRTESKGGVLPDIVFRLRVVKSDLHYDRPVVKHVAGIGGSGAKVLGDALVSHLRQWHPQVERDLIARANTAIVQAADTREVRISLNGLLSLGKKN